MDPDIKAIADKVDRIYDIVNNMEMKLNPGKQNNTPEQINTPGGRLTIKAVMDYLKSGSKPSVFSNADFDGNETEIKLDREKAIRSQLTIPIIQKLFENKSQSEIDILFYEICNLCTFNGLNIELLDACVSLGGNLNQSLHEEGPTPFDLLCANSDSINFKFNIDMLRYCVLRGANLNRNGRFGFYWLIYHNTNNRNKLLLDYISNYNLVNQNTFVEVGKILSQVGKKHYKSIYSAIEDVD